MKSIARPTFTSLFAILPCLALPLVGPGLPSRAETSSNAPMISDTESAPNAGPMVSLSASGAPATAPAAPWAPPPLRINEVGIGGAEYVELFNGGSGSMSLTGCKITTSLGSVSLSNVTQSIAPGGFYVVARLRLADVGVSNDSSVPLKVVSAPLTGIHGDTVILETAGGAVIDAMAYGVSAPTGMLYTRAVNAGQFASGQFVSVANEYGSLALGRNALGKDNNNLALDWTTHGGANAYCGSPFAANDSIPGGFHETVKMIQARLNQVLATIYGCDVTNASHVNYAGTDASSSATHKLVVHSPILGALTLTGNLTYTFIGASSGDYSVKMQGALQDAAAGVQLDVYVNDQKGGTTQTVELIVNLKNLG